ncbi:MAG: PIN domain-containing protein [Haloarculaceae archaeon]
MILDTDFLIALEEGDEAALRKAATLEAGDAPLRVPTVVVQELYVSVGAGDSSFANASKYEALLANKPVVELTDPIARKAGVVQGRHLKSDSKANLGIADAVVAATGLQYNEAVVTSDEDFTHVEGLGVNLLGG